MAKTALLLGLVCPASANGCAACLPAQRPRLPLVAPLDTPACPAALVVPSAPRRSRLECDAPSLNHLADACLYCVHALSGVALLRRESLALYSLGFWTLAADAQALGTFDSKPALQAAVDL